MSNNNYYYLVLNIIHITDNFEIGLVNRWETMSITLENDSQ